MLTQLAIQGFKGLMDADIPLGDTVVFVGPNNSGKTTALQALSIWDLGFRRWIEKRRDSQARERTGVTLNRRDLVAIPIPGARLLWRDLKVRESERENGKSRTRNVLFEVRVSGVTEGESWTVGMEFDYANDESFYCRCMDWPENRVERERVIALATRSRVAYLPPMSGLAAQEFRKEAGEIGVLIGEGRTAEVLRNLCHRLCARDELGSWKSLCDHVERLFRVNLRSPEYLPDRSEIRLEYEQGGQVLDLSCAGRGFQQTLLLLSFLYENPRSVFLLDEPDAHLEVVRQREIYSLLTEVAAAQGSQIIAASHSEVVLNEAADRDVVVAFVGKPHRIDSRQRGQVTKALKSIPFDLYYMAEKHGWILFLEGATDLAILRALARQLTPQISRAFDELPVHYVRNNIPEFARDVFHGLREAQPKLRGLAVFDRLPRTPEGSHDLAFRCWKRREIENYIVTPAILERFARHDLPDDLFGRAESDRRVEIMRDCIREIETALGTLSKPSPWSPDIKVTDEFLDPLFKEFYRRLGLPQLAFKRDYHVLADLVVPGEMAEADRSEIEETLQFVSWLVAASAS
jgi:ABC-type lipoprotein export system ATPase subunit